METVSVEVYSLLSEAKKSRSAGRQAKEAAPEEANQCVFVDFVRVAGVILKRGGVPNEIGNHTRSVSKHHRALNSVREVHLHLVFSPPGVDQIVFQRRIQQQLQKSPRYPGVSINPITT